MNCHYCFDYDNRVEGMTLETAMRAIDWLKTTGCRVIAIMGGEPLLRKDFLLEVVSYGVRNGFFVYVPTNGLLMDEPFIDRVGRAGAAAINLAVDCVEEIPGLPKYLTRIEKEFRYLVKQKERYGYLVFLNINITGKNLKDVRILSEIAQANRIGVDYHVIERPHFEHKHYEHADNDSYIRPDQWEEVDELIDWIIDRNRSGQPMINSVSHLRAMKDFIRGRNEKWICRAGQNSSAIRVDGTLAPCFGMYSAEQDWGSIYEGHKFDVGQLDELREKCRPNCLSTCQYNLGDYYTKWAVMHWVKKHAVTGGLVR